MQSPDSSRGNAHNAKHAKHANNANDANNAHNANNADIDYSVEELPSSVEPDDGAMSSFYKRESSMNITKDRLKRIIQEELSRRRVDVDEGHDSGEGFLEFKGMSLKKNLSLLLLLR